MKLVGSAKDLKPDSLMELRRTDDPVSTGGALSCPNKPLIFFEKLPTVHQWREPQETGC
jgi:hypothetical protein